MLLLPQVKQVMIGLLAILAPWFVFFPAKLKFWMQRMKMQEVGFTEKKKKKKKSQVLKKLRD